MNKKMLWIGAVALSLILGQVAFAHEGSCGCNGERMKKMVETLNLDADQQAKLKSIKEQVKASVKSSKDQIKTVRDQIDQLVQSDKMDENKLNDLISQKKDLIANFMKAKLVAKHQIYTILNAQQKTKYQEMMKQWKEKRKEAFKNCSSD